MNRIIATVAVIVGLLAVGLSAQAGVFGHKHQPSFAERWSPVDDAVHTGTFVVKGDGAFF